MSSGGNHSFQVQLASHPPLDGLTFHGSLEYALTTGSVATIRWGSVVDIMGNATTSLPAAPSSHPVSAQGQDLHHDADTLALVEGSGAQPAADISTADTIIDLVRTRQDGQGRDDEDDND